MNQTFSEEFYWNLLQHDGSHLALTRLQKDIIALEDHTFEGPQGYQAELLETLQQMRTLSRKLWDAASEAPQPSISPPAT